MIFVITSMFETILKGLVLKLYSNAKMPGTLDETKDYDEVTGGGYEPITLDKNLWDITLNLNKPSVATLPEQIFTFTGEVGNVYGYFVVQEFSGKIMWAERFIEGPYKIQNDGDQIKISLKVYLK